MPEGEIGAAEEQNRESPSVLAPTDERVLVADLTRAALAAEFTEECCVFAADEDRYLDGLLSDASGRSDEMLGLGLDTAALLTLMSSWRRPLQFVSLLRRSHSP